MFHRSLSVAFAVPEIGKVVVQRRFAVPVLLLRAEPQCLLE